MKPPCCVSRVTPSCNNPRHASVRPERQLTVCVPGPLKCKCPSLQGRTRVRHCPRLSPVSVTAGMHQCVSLPTPVTRDACPCRCVPRPSFDSVPYVCVLLLACFFSRNVAMRKACSFNLQAALCVDTASIWQEASWPVGRVSGGVLVLAVAVALVKTGVGVSAALTEPTLGSPQGLQALLPRRPSSPARARCAPGRVLHGGSLESPPARPSLPFCPSDTLPPDPGGHHAHPLPTQGPLLLWGTFVPLSPPTLLPVVPAPCNSPVHAPTPRHSSPPLVHFTGGTHRLPAALPGRPHKHPRLQSGSTVPQYRAVLHLPQLV